MLKFTSVYLNLSHFFTHFLKQPYPIISYHANLTFQILQIWMRNTPQSIYHQISINFMSPASFVSWRPTDQRQAKRWPLTPKWLQVLTQERVRGCNRNSFTPQSATPLGGWGCLWASSFCQTGLRYYSQISNVSAV